MRCKFRHRKHGASEGAQCCLDEGHKGPHKYKCCGPRCPGYPWPASLAAHPIECATEDCETLLTEDKDD